MAFRTSTGTVHQCPSGGTGTTNRFTPSSTAARYTPMPASPTTANNAMPCTTSWRTRSARRPSARTPSPLRRTRYTTSHTGASPNSDPSTCRASIVLCETDATRAPRTGNSNSVRIANTALASSDRESTTSVSSASVRRGRGGASRRCSFVRMAQAYGGCVGCAPTWVPAGGRSESRVGGLTVTANGGKDTRDVADVVVVGAGTIGGGGSWFARGEGPTRRAVIARDLSGQGAGSPSARDVRA